MEIKTWLDFGTLSREALDAYTPEELDSLKESITNNEAKAVEDLKREREDFVKTKELAENYKIRAEKAEKKGEKTKPDEELLKRFNNISRKSAGVVEADEVEFFENWKTTNGYENINDDEVVLGKKGFIAELADFRTAKKTQLATSNLKGEGGISEAKANPDYWLSRSTKDGEGNPVFPDDMPREMFTKVLDKLNPKTQGTKMRFYNSK